MIEMRTNTQRKNPFTFRSIEESIINFLDNNEKMLAFNTTFRISLNCFSFFPSIQLIIGCVFGVCADRLPPVLITGLFVLDEMLSNERAPTPTDGRPFVVRLFGFVVTCFSCFRRPAAH